MKTKLKNKQNLEILELDLKDDVVSYLSETTVHGFRYIVEGRNFLERLAWAIFIGFAFYFTVNKILEANTYWDTHPIETTIDEVGLPIHDLPFPAISISDPTPSTMPRKNRWMFVETLLNSLELVDLEEELKHMYPGNIKEMVL